MKKLQNLCFILFFIIPPILFVPSLYEGYGIPKEIIVWVLIPIMLLPLIANKNKLMLSVPVISFGVFVILNFFLLLTIPNKYYGVERLYILLTYFALLLAATNLPEENKKLITTCALFGFAAVASIGVLQYINVIHINWSQLHWEKGFGKRVFSTFGNPNALGSYLILFLPLSIILAIKQTRQLKTKQLHKEKTSRAIFLITSFMGFACLLFTNSWGSMGGFAGAIIVLVVFSGKAQIKIWKQGLIFLLAGFVIISSAFVLSKRSKMFGESTGAVARVLLADAAAHMVKDRPIFGFGPSGFIYYSNSKYLNVLETKTVYDKLWLANPNFILRNPGYPENEYLNFLVDTGIVGFGIFMFFLISLFRSFRRRINNPLETDKKIFILGITSGIVALLIDSFFDIPFSEWYTVGAIFFVLVGFISEKREVKTPKAIIVSLVVVFFIVFFSKAIRVGVGDFYFTKADNASINKNKKLAIEYYKKSASYSILTHMVYSNMGKLAYEENQYDSAVKWYKKSIELLPFHEALHYCLGGVYYKMCDFAKAESSFVYSIKLEPRYSAAYAKLASIYRKEKSYDKALANLLESMKYLPNDAAIRNEVGILYAEKGDKKEAFRIMEQALPLSKYDPVIWYNIYLLSVPEEDKPQFIDLVEFEFISNKTENKYTESTINELLKLYPDYPDALLFYAKMMIKKGNEQEAAVALKKAIYIAPVLYARGGGIMLEELFKRKNNLESANNLLLVASQCYAKKDLNGAESNLRQAIEVNPSLAPAYYNLGVLLSETGDYENAILAWYKFIALDPSNKDVPNIIAGINKLVSQK